LVCIKLLNIGIYNVAGAGSSKTKRGESRVKEETVRNCGTAKKTSDRDDEQRTNWFSEKAEEDTEWSMVI
ncbi:hypothetical protein SOVF_172160, partial [Spinacia oleracea]